MKKLIQDLCKITVAVGVVSNLTACGKTDSSTPSIKVKAAHKIENSLTAIPVNSNNINKNLDSSDLHLDHEHIRLQVSALEKEFLMQVSLIMQPTAAMSHGLKSRVIAFRKKGNKIFIIEATQSHTVTTDLPQNLVIAELPIISEDEESIVIDFNKGMSQLLVADEWRASDMSGKSIIQKTLLLQRHYDIHI